MNSVLAVAILMFGGVAGWIGWRSATKPIYRRSMFEPDSPPGVSRRQHERAVRRRRKIWRVVVTVLYALAGAIGGIIFLLVISRH